MLGSAFERVQVSSKEKGVFPDGQQALICNLEYSLSHYLTEFITDIFVLSLATPGKFTCSYQ